ncbi:hypothetical protein BT69DRAFT_1223782 [Atractiella rhizophila]|nr:hypothetical protein BT69DRAFT_1223782 [Atractiella rhizophila]
MYPKKRSSPGISKRTRKELSPANVFGGGPSRPLVAAEVLAAAQREQEFVDREKEKESLGLYEHDYMEDVKDYMDAFQDRTMASVSLIDQQPELEWFMRPYLVDFIIEIHEQYGLRPETLYLTLNIVDRYVSKRIVYKKHYQLVGCAALWIAAKFEDAKDRIPTVHDLVSMCCNAYDEGAFIQMEGHVLQTIDWIVGHPTAEAWLRLACAGEFWEDLKTQNLARFLMELTLFKREFVKFTPRDVATASLLLARFVLGKGRRVNDNADVLEIVELMDLLLREQLDQLSVIVVKKYSTKYRSHASTLVRQWYLSGNRFSMEDWSRSTPERPRRRQVAAPLMSSVSFMSSSSSDSSILTNTSGSASDTDLSEPPTPYSAYSSSSIFSCHSNNASKENFPASIPSPKKLNGTSSRPALSNNRWKPNVLTDATTSVLTTLS